MPPQESGTPVQSAETAADARPVTIVTRRSRSRLVTSLEVPPAATGTGAAMADEAGSAGADSGLAPKSKVLVIKKPGTRLNAPVATAAATVDATESAPAAQRVALPSAAPRDDAAASKSEARPAGKTVVKSTGKTVAKTASSSPAGSITVASRGTHAAALAAVDTSAYTLPTVKQAARRGRKPSEYQPETEEIAAVNAAEQAEMLGLSSKKSPAVQTLSEAELEIRRKQVTLLVNLGRERGYLTHAEINDHLPDNLTDADTIGNLIGTFTSMGITVCEQAPDSESLLLNDGVAPVASDDDAEAVVSTALSAVDADFGRSTDPVRMYMREMASVQLLNRQQEIAIARRIEDGLTDMMQAISANPATIAEVLALAAKLEQDQIKVDDFIDGFNDVNAEAAAPAEDDDQQDAELAER